jgi:hypothetical protein
MLGLLIATPEFYWIYHARVSYALSTKLFAAGLFLVTLVCAERALEGRACGTGMAATVGAIGGVLFFEHLLYFPLVIYPALLIAVTTPVRLMPAIALLAAGCGIVSALVLLVAFYAGDIESIDAAVSAHFVGLAAGIPISQPGYYENFVTLFLDRRSSYFACHVILVAGALVAVMTLVVCFLCELRRRSDRTTLVLGLLLAGHLAIVAAFAWPFRKHPSYATVFAATIESLFFIVIIVVVASGALRPVWSRRLAWTTGGIAATMAAIVLSHSTGAIDAPTHARRALLLYWQFLASEVFSNGISGLIYNRYQVQRERHPRFRFWQSQNVADVADRCYAKAPALTPGRQGAGGIARRFPLPSASDTRTITTQVLSFRPGRPGLSR